MRLHGERLDGVWTLVPAHMDGDPKNWLLLRKDDAGGTPARYAPMLSTSAETIPQGEEWVYEPKWDGYRALVTVSGGEVTFTSRNGNDLTEPLRRVRARRDQGNPHRRGRARRRDLRPGRARDLALLAAPVGSGDAGRDPVRRARARLRAAGRASTLRAPRAARGDREAGWERAPVAAVHRRRRAARRPHARRGSRASSRSEPTRATSRDGGARSGGR